MDHVMLPQALSTVALYAKLEAECDQLATIASHENTWATSTVIARFQLFARTCAVSL